MGKSEFTGCGRAATHIVFRGKDRRLWACDACRPQYQGSGKVAPYAALRDEEQAPQGTFSGPARTCGERAGE